MAQTISGCAFILNLAVIPETYLKSGFVPHVAAQVAASCNVPAAAFSLLLQHTAFALDSLLVFSDATVVGPWSSWRGLSRLHHTLS